MARVLAALWIALILAPFGVFGFLGGVEGGLALTGFVTVSAFVWAYWQGGPSEREKGIERLRRGG